MKQKVLKLNKMILQKFSNLKACTLKMVNSIRNQGYKKARQELRKRFGSREKLVKNIAMKIVDVGNKALNKVNKKVKKNPKKASPKNNKKVSTIKERRLNKKV